MPNQTIYGAFLPRFSARREKREVSSVSMSVPTRFAAADLVGTGIDGAKVEV